VSSNLCGSGDEFCGHNVGIEVQNYWLGKNVGRDGIERSLLVYQQQHLNAAAPSFYAIQARREL
jgi:hypothetical protein